MPLDGPTADTCLCGSTHWHKMVDTKTVWCTRCGALRTLFEGPWHIPLDHVGALSRSTAMPEEAPTRPGTPDARRRDGDTG